MEVDILELSQRLEEQVHAASPLGRSFGRSPLAPLHPNLNPFGLTHQRNKAVRKAGAAQPAGRPDNSPRAAAFGSQCSGASDADSAAAGTPVPQLAADAASARPSPTPFQLFRGRLSFGIDGSSGRKLELARTTPRVATLAVKRRLTDSPSGGDLMLVFPSVKRAAACKRRCPSMGDVMAAVAAAESEQQQEGEASQQQQYWSDPLPLPSGLELARPAAEGGAEAMSLGDDDMRDDAASPLSPSMLGLGAAEAAGCSGGGSGNGAAGLGAMGGVCQPSPFCQPAAAGGGWGLAHHHHADAAGAFGSTFSLMDADAPSPLAPSGGMGSASCAEGSGLFSGGRAGGSSAAALPPPFSPLASGPSSCVPLVDHPECGLPTITPQTAAELVISQGASHGLEGCVVVDCRYGYEYAGGCIQGAVSLNTPDDMDRFLAETPVDWQTTVLIFHCEFSSERGPRMFRHVRDADRRAHVRDYPALSFPHMFILQGGYKAFCRACPKLCTPHGSYVPMDHPQYSLQLKACHKAVKAAWARTRRSFEQAQQRRARKFVVRPSSAPAVAAAQHPLPRPASADS